jgi:hypothetical protein
MTLPIEIDWNGLNIELREFGYQYGKINVVGAHTGFDWDVLTDEVIYQVEQSHQLGESLIWEMSPFWTKDGNPKIYSVNPDLVRLCVYEVVHYTTPAHERKTRSDYTVEHHVNFASFDKALREVEWCWRQNHGYHDVSINKLSDDGSVIDSYDESALRELTW